MTTVQQIKLTLLRILVLSFLNPFESVRVYSASSSKQLRHFTVKPTFGEIEYNFLEQPNKKQNLQNKPKFGSTNEKYEFGGSNYKPRTVYNSLGLPVNTETSFITGGYPDKPKYLPQFGDANLLNYKKKSKLLSKYPRNKEWRKSSPYYPRKPVFRKNAPYFKKYPKEPKWNPLPAPPIGGLSSMVSLDPTNGQPMIQLIPKTYLEHLELPEEFYFYQPNEIGNDNNYNNKVDYNYNKNHNAGSHEVKEKKNSLSREHLCAALRNQNQKDKTTNNSNGKTVKEAQPAGCGMSIEQFRRSTPVGSGSSGEKSYNRQNSRPDNRSDNRLDNRPDNPQDNRPENRPDNRPVDSRSNNRGSPFTPTTPAPEVVAQDDAQDELITDDTKDDDDQGEPATEDVEEETITTSPDDDNGTETSSAKSTDTTNKKGAKPCTPCLQSQTSTPSYPYPYMSHQIPQQSGYPAMAANSGGHYAPQLYPQQQTQQYSHPRPHPQHHQYHAYHHQPANHPLPSNPPPQYASPSDQSFQYSPAQYPPGPSPSVPSSPAPYPFAPNPPTPYPPTPDPSASYPPVPYPHTGYPPASDPAVAYPHAQYPPAPYPSVGHPTAPYPSVPYSSVPYPPAPYPPAPYSPAPYPTAPYPSYQASEMYPPQPTHSEPQNVQVALSLVDS